MDLSTSLTLDGAPRTLDALREEYAGHLTWPLDEILRRAKHPPTEAGLRAAAEALQRGSPAVLGAVATWSQFTEVLARAGLSPSDRFSALLAIRDCTPLRGEAPDTAALWPAALALTADEASHWGAALLERSDDEDALLAAAVCFAAAGGDVPEALDEAFLQELPPTALGPLLRRLPEPRRQAIIERWLSSTRKGPAGASLEQLLMVPDLLSDAQRTRLADLSKVARNRRLRPFVEAGRIDLDADGLSPLVRPALESWKRARAEAEVAPDDL